MIALEVLVKLNEKPRVIRDNFNRDSSACQSRTGFVIHSGVHRSTAFVSDLNARASLVFWKAAGQAALNGWVEGTVEGLSLEDCELNALQRVRPEWTFDKVKSDKFTYYRASNGNTIVGGASWNELLARTE